MSRANLRHACLHSRRNPEAWDARMTARPTIIPVNSGVKLILFSHSETVLQIMYCHPRHYRRLLLKVEWNSSPCTVGGVELLWIGGLKTLCLEERSESPVLTKSEWNSLRLKYPPSVRYWSRVALEWNSCGTDSGSECHISQQDCYMFVDILNLL